MLILQSRIAFIEADACKAALKNLELDPVPPAGYNAMEHLQPLATCDSSAEAEDVDFGPGTAELSEAGVRLPSATDEQLQRLIVEVRSIQVGLLLHQAVACVLVAAGSLLWLPWQLCKGSSNHAGQRQQQQFIA